MTATKIQPGDDLHLTSLMAPHSLNFVTGPDRAALLAYGRDVFAAGLAGSAPAAVSQRGEYPQLPEGVMFIEQVGGDVIGRPTDYGFKHGRGIVHGAELFTSEQLRAYFDLGRQPSTAAPALEAPPAVAPQGEYPHEQMDAMALARYKVVPSHASMLWSHAVVAGDGAQQLYVGREVECQNMARKFAGAFLDGAFAFHSMAAAPTAQAAPALEAPAAVDGDQLDSLARKKLGALLNAFGEAQWQAGRGVPCPSIEDAFEAVISAAVALLAAAPQAPAQEAPAAPAPAVPDGWRLVPANPTDAMLGAAQKAWLADPLRRSSTVYAAALAAAPQAPAAPVHSKTYSDGTVATGSGELPAQSPQQQVLCTLLDTVEAMLGGANGPTIQIRPALLAAPAAPAVDASDTALLDAMERERIAVIPEFEGPWDAQIFGEDESTLACGSGATPRKAIAEALVSLEARKAHDAAQAKEGGAPVADAAPLDVCTDPYNCARCKTHPAHRGDMHHAGISRIGGSA